MQLTAREDIEAPLNKVFAELSDFQAIERQALRRGIQVQRTDKVSGVAAGMAWDAKFGFRGKSRNAEIVMTGYTPPEQMVFSTTSGGLSSSTTIDFVALSRGRTRISVTTDLNPTTLSARLLVQSLKLAKGGIDKRFRHRMAGFAKDLENRLRRLA